MTYSLTWLLPVLRGAGLKVAEVPGWTERACRPGARGEMGRIEGVICHHTATTAGGNLPSLGTLLRGRSDVPGPLAQLALARDGTYHLIAAGRCNHAGTGEGVFRKVSGNGNYIGIEAENPLPYHRDWPDVQFDAYHRGVAAILKHVGANVGRCIAHKEYAPGRKPVDPAFNMDEFRRAVADIMGGGVVRPLISAVDGAGQRTIRRGDRGEDVKRCQRAVGAADDGRFGPGTEAAVRAYQRQNQLVPDGIVGPQTWARIGP
jgi:peptidoglycan hydrolase-like protein with peptidoglycan-binding domain